MFILMFLVYYMYLFMPKYKKRTYLLEIDPLFILGAIGGLLQTTCPFQPVIYDSKRRIACSPS